VYSECLPFTSVPHSTRLFLDFLSYSGDSKRFFPRSPYISEWAAEEQRRISYDANRRAAVATLMERQNTGWGASERTQANLKKFRDGASVIVTGQQVGVFGGPLFAVLKALTALQLVAKAEAAGVPAVPVFWLATEDHDLAEVSRVSLPAPDGSLAVMDIVPKAIEDAPVGGIRFGDEVREHADRIAELLGPSDVTDALLDAYKSGATLGDAFAKLYSKIFAEWGVILIDAFDPEYHRIAGPIYEAAIARAGELDRLLLERGKELETSGYHQQVKVTSSSTLLFEIQDGKRQVIQRSNDHFRVGTTRYTNQELVSRVSAHPENFSANVLLRPVVQDYLLPTLAYTGGPAEIAYFAQAAVVYEQLLGRVTPVLPRCSATIVEPKQQKLLAKYKLRVADLFRGIESVRVQMAQHVLPASLNAKFDSTDAGIARSMEEVRVDLQRLDPTLVEAARKAEAKMRYQVKRLAGRAARAELLRNSIIDSHAQNLTTHLFPHKNLPEREIAGVYYLAKYGLDLLHQLHEAAGNECPDHQVLYLER
jgi:bacillithiol synthase